jgi:hypothetical protein
MNGERLQGGSRRFDVLPLGWLAVFALVLQMVGAPALLLRDAASAANPIRTAQLLCDPAAAGTPAQDHRRVPAPDTRQCLANHAGVVLVLASGRFFAPLPRGMSILRAVFPPDPALGGIAHAAYAARAPPLGT